MTLIISFFFAVCKDKFTAISTISKLHDKFCFANSCVLALTSKSWIRWNIVSMVRVYYKTCRKISWEGYFQCNTLSSYKFRRKRFQNFYL